MTGAMQARRVTPALRLLLDQAHLSPRYSGETRVQLSRCWQHVTRPLRNRVRAPPTSTAQDYHYYHHHYYYYHYYYYYYYYSYSYSSSYYYYHYYHKYLYYLVRARRTSTARACCTPCCTTAWTPRRRPGRHCRRREAGHTKRTDSLRVSSFNEQLGRHRECQRGPCTRKTCETNTTINHKITMGPMALCTLVYGFLWISSPNTPQRYKDYRVCSSGRVYRSVYMACHS